MLQAVQACHRCRDRKKRCDRSLPQCSDCKRRKLQCHYSQKAEERQMVESLGQKLKSLERSMERSMERTEDDALDSQQFLPLPRVERSIQYEVSYPVSKRWYFPMLLHFRFNAMVPTIKQLSPDSAAYKLRTAWVTGYLSNPVMFHAVLYAASANLDLVNREHDNPVTNFHRAEAIRLLRETISTVDAHDNLPVAALAATWALAHVARLNGSTFDANLHETGLAQMISCRGQNADLGFDGALSFLIMLSDIWNAVINEEDTNLDFINGRQSPYIAQPRRTLLSNALRRIPKEGLLSKDLLSFLLRMADDLRDNNNNRRETFDNTNDISKQPSCQSSLNSFPPGDHKYILMLLEAERLISLQQHDYISECCCLAAMIYWQVLSSNVPFFSPDNECIAEQLFISLKHSDVERWMDEAPELHIWICYVGALASASRARRASFLAKSKISVVILSPDGVTRFQDGVSHLLCLSRYMKQQDRTRRGLF